jgi:hypothetical protein
MIKPLQNFLLIFISNSELTACGFESINKHLSAFKEFKLKQDHVVIQSIYILNNNILCFTMTHVDASSFKHNLIISQFCKTLCNFVGNV